jgi:hypothetical protein
VCSATAYTQFATLAAVEYLARHAATRVHEAGDAYRERVGNAREQERCRMKCGTGWGPSGRKKSWRCEPLSFAYFSLRRQRKVGAAPHRGDAWSTKAKRGCQRKSKNAERLRREEANPDASARLKHRTAPPAKGKKNPGLDRGNDTLFNVSERLTAWPLKSRPCGAVHTASHFDSVSRGCAPTDDGASVNAQVKPDPLKPLHRYQTAAFLAEAAVREA